MAKYVIKKLDDNSIIIFNLSKNNTFKNFHEIWEILTYINQNNQGKVYIDNLYNDSHKRFYNVELMQDLQFFRRKTKYIPSNIIKECTKTCSANNCNLSAEIISSTLMGVSHSYDKNGVLLCKDTNRKTIHLICDKCWKAWEIIDNVRY